MSPFHINVPSFPPGLDNKTTAIGGIPPMDLGRAVCNEFYGSFQDANDCLGVIQKLPLGSDEIPYTVGQGYGPHRLPQSFQAGNCMIQVELAGQRLPATFPVVPNTLRQMATYLQSACTKGKSRAGGFITGSLEPVAQWLESAEGELDNPIPSSAAYLTLALSNSHIEYLSPGKFDPAMATIFALSLDEALKAPISSTMAAKLQDRESRLLRQRRIMTPRGRKVPWWADPGPVSKLRMAGAPDNTTEDALQGQDASAAMENSGISRGSARIDKDEAIFTARRLKSGERGENRTGGDM